MSSQNSTTQRDVTVTTPIEHFSWRFTRPFEGPPSIRLKPHLGNHRLGALRPDHVQAMLTRIAQEPARSRRKKDAEVQIPPTAGTLLNIRAVLRAALNDAVRQQLVARNVATLVVIPTPRRQKPVALSAQQVQMFLMAAKEHQLFGLWFLVAVYGLRRAEAAGLSWDGVDLKAKLLTVQRTVLEIEGDHRCPVCGRLHRRLKLDTTKTPAGERIFPLVPAVEAVLDRRRLQQQTARELYGADYAEHGLIFSRPDGNPWRPDWISSQFTDTMSSSGAADGMSHRPSIKALLSTMVTNLHEAGVPLEVISRITGHTGGAVTRDHYLHVSAERTRKEFTDIAERAAAATTTPAESSSTGAEEPLDIAQDMPERSDPLTDPQLPEGREPEAQGEEN